MVSIVRISARHALDGCSNPPWNIFAFPFLFFDVHFIIYSFPILFAIFSPLIFPALLSFACLSFFHVFYLMFHALSSSHSSHTCFFLIASSINQTLRLSAISSTCSTPALDWFTMRGRCLDASLRMMALGSLQWTDHEMVLWFTRQGNSGSDRAVAALINWTMSISLLSTRYVIRRLNFLQVTKENGQQQP
jgi:hypothetical protein